MDKKKTHISLPSSCQAPKLVHVFSKNDAYIKYVHAASFIDLMQIYSIRVLLHGYQEQSSLCSCEDE